MSVHKVEVKGLDVTVDVHWGVSTASAWVLVFDEDATVVYDGESRVFSGFCEAEIVATLLGDALLTRRQIEWDDINPALDALGLFCNCED